MKKDREVKIIRYHESGEIIGEEMRKNEDHTESVRYILQNHGAKRKRRTDKYFDYSCK